MRSTISLCAGVLLALSASAQASISLSVSGLFQPPTGVTADVEFTYQSLSDTAAKIIIDIENTTPAAVGGWITAFGFNVPTLAGIVITSIGGDVDDSGKQYATGLGSPNESGWYARLDAGNIKTPNAAGDFDFGVMNADSVNAFITDGVGGPSAPKILIGETTTFTLDVVGTGLDNLTDAAFETAFMSELSTGLSGPGYNFGVRFQGLANDGSDLAVGTVIPVPSAALLALLGLSGAGVVARRRNRAA
ncbi:MAG: hypothetical protein HY763_11400 [Planctomycetes bacterium]|nr:hypothetical protein [Planctomycetota bacterium]